MRTIFTYKDKEYYFESEVRKELYKDTRTVYPVAPEGLEEKVAFWAELNVAYREEEDPIPPEPSLDEVKAEKLRELEERFNDVTSDCAIDSTTGLRVNADDTAHRNVQSLIQYFPTGVESVKFCDYDNNMQDVTLEQLEVIGREIVLNAQYLYQQKWEYREAINAAETVEEVQGILIDFNCKDFA